MPARPNRHDLTCLLLTTLLVACGTKSEQDTGETCDAPVANAGTNITTTLGSQVQLDGSASTVCEKYADELTFTWSLLQAPTTSAIDESALSDNKTTSAAQPVFQPDETGTYTFQLVVSDPVNDSAADVVTVQVEASDAAPTADCGGPYEGSIDESVQLDGSGSSDPEHAELSYFWSMVGLPDCSGLGTDSIYNAGGPTPTVVPDCDGIYTVSLVVSDGVHYSDAAVCYIDVASENRAPVADAGENKDLGACADNPITLNGWGSYDPDDDDLTYEWSLVSVPEDSAATIDDFDDVTSAEPRFSWDVEGDYLFQLQVSDGQVWSAPDLVTMTIQPSTANHDPVANAGMDQSVETAIECSSSSYTWTCPDCEEEQVELDATGSSDVDGDELSYYWSEATDVMTFSNRYGVMTYGIIAAQPAEYGVDTTMVLTVSLDVADCATSDNDTITVTYTCTGEAP